MEADKRLAQQEDNSAGVKVELTRDIKYWQDTKINLEKWLV
jgi:hypothetical protein